MSENETPENPPARPIGQQADESADPDELRPATNSADIFATPAEPAPDSDAKPAAEPKPAPESARPV